MSRSAIRPSVDCSSLPSLRSDYDRLALVKHMVTAVRALASQPRTLHELAASLGMTPRSARRYVYALRDAGIDVLARPRSTAGNPMEYRLDRRAWIGLLDLPMD